MNFISIKDYAEKHNVATRTARRWCENGRIEGAQKIGRDWIIPENAERAVDRRYVENPIRNRRKK